MVDNRYTGVIIWDAVRSNPNGDPDAGNRPRTDPITGNGVVSNHSLKRKMRDTLKTLYGEKLYVERGTNLTNTQKLIAESLNLPDTKRMKAAEKAEVLRENDKRLVEAMVENFIDVRLFGGVITQSKHANGQVVGPVQVSDGVSVDPVSPMSFGLTCCAGAGDDEVKKTPKKSDDEAEEDADMKDKTKNMGSRWIIPYGLYVAHFDVTPTACRNSMYTEEDLEKLFCAIERMFDLHQTSTSGEQALRKFYLFKHSSKYGDQPRHELYEAVKITRKDESKTPASYDDYDIHIDKDAVADTIEIIERVK